MELSHACPARERAGHGKGPPLAIPDARRLYDKNPPEHHRSRSRIPALEITRLAQALAAARLESANRLAAIRAALGAAADGETDPLAYLRDQLAEETGIQIPGTCESGR